MFIHADNGNDNNNNNYVDGENMVRVDDNDNGYDDKSDDHDVDGKNDCNDKNNDGRYGLKPKKLGRLLGASFRALVTTRLTRLLLRR